MPWLQSEDPEELDEPVVLEPELLVLAVPLELPELPVLPESAGFPELAVLLSARESVR